MSIHQDRIVLKEAILMNKYLEQGWDGYSAEVINHSSIEQALTFLDILPLDVRLPRAMPEPEGEVSLYWRVLYDSQSYAEICFDKDVQGTYFGFLKDGRIYHKFDQYLVNEGIEPKLLLFLRYQASKGPL